MNSIKKSTLSLFLILLFIGCDNSDSPYPPRMIGDIAHQPEIDGDFELCNWESRAIQYYALAENTYGGEKFEIQKIFEKQYQPEDAKKESGLVRIRFIVNCKGETGRFRILGMDEDYNEKIFDKSITDQLLKITKSLDNWKTFERNGANPDFYQYLIFKIKEGQIIEILP